jgi:hypothetical protein
LGYNDLRVVHDWSSREYKCKHCGKDVKELGRGVFKHVHPQDDEKCHGRKMRKLLESKPKPMEVDKKEPRRKGEKIQPIFKKRVWERMGAERIAHEKLKNTKTLVGAANKAAEGHMDTKKSSREALVAKIAEIAENKRANAFKRLREVANGPDIKKAGDAMGELANNIRIVADSFSNLHDHLDFAAPAAPARPTASMRSRYGAEFRRVADKNPELVAEALIELYRSLDKLCAGVENLASNLGIELPDEEEEGFIEEAGPGGEALAEEGEALESPEMEQHEEESGFEGTEMDERQDQALATAKEATGGAWVTDRDESAEPKPVEKAEIPRSQGEAAIRQK